MRRYNRYRVPYFHDLLVQARKLPPCPEADRDIVRRPGNPMLRYVGGAVRAPMLMLLFPPSTRRV